MKLSILTALIILSAGHLFAQTSSKETAKLVFGQVIFEATPGGTADTIGCQVINARRDGYGIFQDAYNKAVKNCQALYESCFDTQSSQAWVSVVRGEDTPSGNKTCIVEAAVYGMQLKAGAAKVIESLESERIKRALLDQ